MSEAAPVTNNGDFPDPETLAKLSALGQRLLRLELVGKVDLSGVLQQTLMDVHDAGSAFPAGDSRHRHRWLVTAYRRNLTDAIRRVTRVGEDRTRDVALDGLTFQLVCDGSTPSTPLHRAEDAQRLVMALAKIPPEQAIAVVHRHIHGMAVAEIAEELGRSKLAIAGLIKRGLKALRVRLTEDPPTTDFDPSPCLT